MTLVRLLAARCMKCGFEAEHMPWGVSLPAVLERDKLRQEAQIPHSSDCNGQMLLELEPASEPEVRGEVEE